jgi:hypothetical protein
LSVDEHSSSSSAKICSSGNQLSSPTLYKIASISGRTPANKMVTPFFDDINDRAASGSVENQPEAKYFRARRGICSWNAATGVA